MRSLSDILESTGMHCAARREEMWEMHEGGAQVLLGGDFTGWDDERSAGERGNGRRGG